MKISSRVTLLVLLWIPLSVFSQGIGLSNEQIVLDVRPKIIQPNQRVSTEITSYSTDINRAQVSLYADGVLLEQGIGLKRVQVDAPRVGETQDLRVVVKTIDQGTVTRTLTLAPSQVDLVYEATNSYAPPLYQGKALPAHEGGVRVAAIPYMLDTTGNKIDNKSLVYTWKVGTQVQQNQSGFGRDVLVFEGSPYYSTKSISVQVESVDGSRVAERSIDIPAYDPVIRFYPQNPLWGRDMSRAIIADQPLLLGVPEMIVESVPFFVSDSSSNSAVSYDWRMNGQPMTTFGDRNIINLRAPEQSAGQAKVELKVTHNDKILQIAQSLFTVVFGEEAVREAQNRLGESQTTNFFGTSN